MRKVKLIMEFEKIKELIQKARLAAKTDDFRELVDSFEGFVDLYNQKERATEDLDFRMKLDESHRKFWSHFEKVSAMFGLNPETMRDYFENSKNFSPAQWEQMQNTKRIVEEQSAPSSPSKLRKNANKVRI